MFCRPLGGILFVCETPEWLLGSEGAAKASIPQSGESSQWVENFSSGFSILLTLFGSSFSLCDFPAVSVRIYLPGNKVLSGRVDGMRRGT